jgi:anthranilate phosphoribosyltransferase
MNNTDYTTLNNEVIRARDSIKNLVDRPDKEKIAFLTEIHDRGETPMEIAGFAMALREMSAIKLRYPGLTDIVGTGGDGKNTVNVSTAASILLASMGIKTAKHGNFGITGHHGSADFMKYINYSFKMDDKNILNNISIKNYVYILAPEYNKSFAKFSSARKQLSFRTVFNILGPLTNPLNPDKVVLGTYNDKLAQLYSNVILKEGKKGFVINSSDGMDEISPAAKSTLYSIDRNIKKIKLDPEKIIGHNIEICDISTADSEKSFEMLLAGLSGTDKNVEEFIAINASPAVIINGLANDMLEAYDLSMKYIDSGKAREKLKEVCS